MERTISTGRCPGSLKKSFLEGVASDHTIWRMHGVGNCSPDDVESAGPRPTALELGHKGKHRELHRPYHLDARKFGLSWNEVSFGGFRDFKDFPNDAHMHPESRTSAPNWE